MSKGTLRAFIEADIQRRQLDTDTLARLYDGQPKYIGRRTTLISDLESIPCTAASYWSEDE
jgi:hypothetical protein